MSVDNKTTEAAENTLSSVAETPSHEQESREVCSQSQAGTKSSILGNFMRMGSILPSPDDVSKINLMSLFRMSTATSVHASMQRRSLGLSSNALIEEILLSKRLSDPELNTKFFPQNLTKLLNEDQLWGCFYNFPEFYQDIYSPIVHIREEEDVHEMVGGILTRDMVTACLSYLKRTPILGDFVYIKLNLSSKHLINIDVLQHYKYLVYLDLSSNLLTELTILSHLLYLQYLSVDFNRLETVLEYDVAQWFLSEVHYKFNSVKRIRDLTIFWSLTVLNLSHNNIKCISGLENLRHIKLFSYLRRLDLSFNHIQRLENLNNLRLLWLDVSYNNISSFEFGPQTGLWTLLHLEYLNLNENNLTSMKMFCGCTRLRELHARNNRLSMLLELAVYMRQMRRLVILDLRANPICSTPGYEDVIINTFPILLSLDAKELDPVKQRDYKMDMNPDIMTFATRRLLRLLYIEQLGRAHVSPHIPPADTDEMPMVILVGYEAVGKGSLARSLAQDCNSNVELAKLHTTATHHYPGHYEEVSNASFDEMLLQGEFLTYSEMNGESYGLSRKEAFVRNGKVKIASMDLTSALMLKLRGRRPYLILATCLDKQALFLRQEERKQIRDKIEEDRTSIEVPMEKSTLQVLISGRILITGILNEILLSLPDEKEASEFVIESECSLLMPSGAREARDANEAAVRDYAKGVNLLTLLTCSSVQEEMTSPHRTEKNSQQDTSLCSLYKESQNTDEYASDASAGGHGSYQDSNKKSASNNKPDKTSSTSRPKSVDFCRYQYQSSTWKGIKQTLLNRPEITQYASLSGVNSVKSVIISSQDNTDNIPTAYPDVSPVDPSGMVIEPPKQASDKETGDKRQGRSMSTKLPFLQPGPHRTASGASLDDADLWLAFLLDTGLLKLSDTNADAFETGTRHETRVDDPEHIIRQLSNYFKTPSHHLTTNVRDDYDDIHRECPGLFWDTVNMDNPDEAFLKVKRIIRELVNEQNKLKPMFQIDFANMKLYHPLIENKLTNIRKLIAPRRFFF